MRAIARHSARLAKRPRCCVHNQHQHQHQHLYHARSFSQTHNRRIEGRTPPGPSDHSVSKDLKQPQEEQLENGSSTISEEKAASEENTSESRKGTKTIRQRRREASAPEIPKPPPIPEWFLKHNVRLQSDTVAPNRDAKNAQVLRCVDSESGHTLFTVPYYKAWPVPGLQESQAGSSSTVEQPSSLNETFFDNKYTTPPPRTTESKSKSTEIRSPPSNDAFGEINPHSLLRWSLLEAETGICAAYSLASEGPHQQSQAASHVDIFLFCPDSDSHDQMDEYVQDLANITHSDLIRLDANDFEDLLEDYVSGGSDSPGSFSRLAYDAFSGYSASDKADRFAEDMEDDEIDEDEDEDERPDDLEAGSTNSLDHLRRALFNSRHDLNEALSKLSVVATPVFVPRRSLGSEPNGLNRTWNETKLRAILDNLLDARDAKRKDVNAPEISAFRHRLVPDSKERNTRPGLTPGDVSHQALWRVWRSSPGCWYPDVAGVLAGQIQTINDKSKSSFLRLEPSDELAQPAEASSRRRTIVHVRDLKDIIRSSTGQAIVQGLLSLVRNRRKAGQEIVLVGTTAQDSESGFFRVLDRYEEHGFRRIPVPPFFNLSKEEQNQFSPDDLTRNHEDGTYRRILEINLRHLQSMLSRLRPSNQIDLFTESSQAQLKLSGDHPLSQRVLPFELVQRIVLTAIGLAQVHARSDVISAGHIGLAVYTTVMSDKTAQAWSSHKARRQNLSGSEANPKHTSNGKGGADAAGVDKGQTRIEKLKKSCSPHESKLLSGVVDPQNIKTGFKEVHAPEETLDALRTLTSLSLLRPDAFKYGVLAADRLPGLMLYGPPGTGKTLLAKAVAKESKATMLEVSGAQIYEKYVGEGEKMVRAVFSLAKKLSPCIVFIDEADAIFGSRSSAGNRNTHREIINQFLREWDGMDLHNVFIMVASNRPFDMDDAVLRRLPRRLLVDLPVAKDRESILRIHLTDEALDETVSLSELAQQTPLYSGSDLKNVCVAAALACVREENELAESKRDDRDFKLPEKRTLSAQHFETAVKEISASISEDMTSLTAIRKFDEQYGDRRGRRKKTPYGFGTEEIPVDEGAARVRQSPPAP